MRTRIYVVVPLILLSALFFVLGRNNVSNKPFDFRDAPRDTSAIEALKSQNQGEDLVMPRPAIPEGIIDRISAEVLPENSGGRGSGVPTHKPTPEQKKAMSKHNEGLFKSFAKSVDAGRPVEVKYRPYADYEKTGYLIMSSEFSFDSRQAKLEMAKILPAEAVLVVLTEYSSQKQEILDAYGAVLPPGRIKVVILNGGGSGFWARDAVPVPVLDKSDKLTVIDAQYYHGFAVDEEISRIFSAGYKKHDYFYEGGNFQANTRGDCVIVNNKYHAKIPDEIFNGYYGCKQLIRLPFIDGIGHVDERARFINDTTLVTDTPSYKDILAGKGFTVQLLPRPSQYYETYVNSLIMDGKVVVPVFNEATDAQALAVYESLGLKASGGDSVSLSNDGKGSIHCITMTYPKVPMADLLKSLGAKEI